MIGFSLRGHTLLERLLVHEVRVRVGYDAHADEVLVAERAVLNRAYLQRGPVGIVLGQLLQGEILA